MITLFVILHVIVSLFLITVVLIQGGKGAEMGASFGGSSQTVFGSRGAATFMSKMTTIVAVAFMLTSLLLAVVANKSESVIKGSQPAANKSGAPGAIPGGPSGMPAGIPGQAGLPGGPGAPVQIPGTTQQSAPVTPATPTAPVTPQAPSK